MTRWGRVIAGLTLGGGLVSCAYYNGLYNASRLATDARRAEREGRSGEARTLWRQAAIKAESVAVRHPASKYRDDALVLAGRAYRELGECGRAIPPLRLAADSSPARELRNRARLLLGQCYALAGEAEAARDALTPLVDSAAAALAADARWWRGRAELAAGAYRLALEDLLQVGAIAAGFDRALAYLGLDSLDAAVAALDMGDGVPYDEVRWREVLGALGRRTPARAAVVVDRLVARPDLSGGARARLLLGDGDRWAAAGAAERAAARFETARETASDSLEAGWAHVRLATLELRGARELRTALGTVRRLEAATRHGGPVAREADRYLPVVRELGRVLEDSGAPGNDLRAFLVAEQLRDSLGAPQLAALVFEWLPAGHPDSPLAPKALLAAAALTPARAGSLLAVLEREYPSSPYLLVLRGEGRAAYQAIEDSLRVLLTETSARTRRGGAGVPPPRERRP